MKKLLKDITFKGTVIKWESISKGKYWRVESPLKVTCSDGILYE